jgi:hypothetical protein
LCRSGKEEKKKDKNEEWHMASQFTIDKESHKSIPV